MWYWRQCSWYFLSFMSQLFSTEGNTGKNMRKSKDTKHNTYKVTIHKQKTQHWKRKRHFTMCPVLFQVTWFLLFAKNGVLAKMRLHHSKTKPNKNRHKTNVCVFIYKMHSRIQDIYIYIFTFLQLLAKPSFITSVCCSCVVTKHR